MPTSPSASSLLWQAAGSPGFLHEEEGRCRLCGADSSGRGFWGWVKDTFNDHDKLFPGAIICQACQFCCDEASTLLQQRVGKEKPQRMRNYSHFVLDGAWLPLSKGHKRRMREVLEQHPTIAVIADSGQKHIIFRARCGFWQFEEQKMEPCPILLTNLLSLIAPLYQGGASKGEIESGHYAQKSMQKIGIGIWAANEKGLRQYRGGLPFKLALFLVQKTEEPNDT